MYRQGYFVDNDSDDDNEYEKQRSGISREEKLWDSFQDPPAKKKAGSSAEETERFDSMVKMIKFVVCVIVFIMILGTSILSKISLLFMTSHLATDRRIPFCNINLPDKFFEAVIPTEQRIAWIWAIVFSYAVPELGTFFRAARMCFFKQIERPKLIVFIMVFCAETLHVIGMAILLIVILPGLDVIQGVMLTNCLCIVPALLSLFADWQETSDRKTSTFKKLKIPLNLLALCAQLTGCVVWPLLYNDTNMWLIPVSICFISFHWWENFVSDKSRFSFIVYMDEVKKSLGGTRYITYLYISAWKIIVFLIVSIFLSQIDFTLFFTDFLTGWGNHTIPVEAVAPILTDYERFPELANVTSDLLNQQAFSAPAVICWTLFIQVVASYGCYVFTKFACKIQIQSFSFGLPINLTVPMSVSILLILCGIRATEVCAFHDSLPDYLFWTPPPVHNLDDYIVNEFAWISILWILSQTWITRHIWVPKSDKNAASDSLFITPLYNGLIIDQSLSLNRRREDLADIIQKKDLDMRRKHKSDEKEDPDLHEQNGSFVRPEDKIPQIFICATMWHENKEEMMEFLKSILRLDEDQSARRLARNYIQTESEYIDPEYYDLETHIFFDDAFIIDKTKKHDTETNPINEYVKTLITSISDAAREVHKTEMKIREPQKYVTPYGGRLVWILPGKTKMIAHLKHADKIRKKKRWSQVMYMYYLLGYRIMQLDIPDERKLVISKNTFLLALDGDIDFQPNAVQLLISRMKIDEHLGAACGRIHPIGDGPMVWYQKFEYAIGHWLQKATEHVIGCVLCSPGCFSLFRGRALMENSVMKKYTTNSEVARHFVQYDQGEDRWLCTLLLKQRFRVEYSAASDAYTHSPEGFNEFYNQRRRWVPSTMANILDLLMDAKEIVKTNDSISMPYIVYQSMLMVGTILGPGTIFLMMIGSLVSVFGIDIWTAFLWNFFPLLIFMFICFRFKQKYQLAYAFGLTAIYALVMMAVLIGVIIQFMEDGIASPTSMFFFAVAGQIVIAGILHPLEISCLFHGIIYYITIPSMYMLLVIYSLFNMNDVSWGTRETPKPAEAQPKAAENQGPAGKYFAKGTKEEDGSIDISLFGLFRCMLCTHPKPSEVQVQLAQVTMQLNEITNQIRDLEMKAYVTGNIARKSGMAPRQSDFNQLETGSIISSQSTSIVNDIVIEEEPAEKSVNTLPDWLYDPDIRNGEIKSLGQTEQKFWIEMIEKYLKPLDLDKKQLDDNKEMLKVLRDMSVFAFVMVNALFVLVVFLLQLNKEYIHFKWPWGATNYITFDESTMEISIEREYLELEPIGLLFVLFFGVILLIQFIAMLMHRFGTISQILAATDLDWYCGKKPEEVSAEADMRGKAVTIARKLQKPKAQWDDEELDEEQKNIARRRDTIKKILIQRQKKKQDYSDLERNFKEMFLGADSLSLGNLKLKRKTTLMLEKRRSTIKARQSISQPAGAVFNPAGILMGNPRPSLINPGHHFNYPRSYDNHSFEPELMEMDEISLDNYGSTDNSSMPRHRSSHRPNHRPSHLPNSRPSIVTFA